MVQPPLGCLNVFEVVNESDLKDQLFPLTVKIVKHQH